MKSRIKNGNIKYADIRTISVPDSSLLPCHSHKAPSDLSSFCMHDELLATAWAGAAKSLQFHLGRTECKLSLPTGTISYAQSDPA